MKRKLVETPCSLVSAVDDMSDISENEEAFEDRLRNLKQQLKMLNEKSHPDYLKAKRKVDSWLSEEKQRVSILNDHRLDTISREYKKEIESCDRDFELEKRRIQEYFILLCEELKRRLEADKKNLELTLSGDILESKPTVTRKLRRRAGCDLPVAASGGIQTLAEHFFLSHSMDLGVNGSTPSQYDGCNLMELLSPIPNNGNENTQESSSVPENDFFDSCKPGQASPNSTTNSYKKVKSSSVKGNLFGSLGFNIFEWGPFPQLLASVNNTGMCQPSQGQNTGPTGNFIGYLYNLMCNAPSGSAAAAISAGVMLSSSLPSSHPANKLAIVLNAMAGNGQSNSKKRRQQNAAPSAQLNLLLPETDIYADLTIIHRACAKAASTGTGCGSRKQQALHGHSLDSPPHSFQRNDHGLPNHSRLSREMSSASMSSPRSGSMNSPNPHDTDLVGRNHSTSSTSLSVWIDDGRLYCGQKCFQNGALVILEGREGSNHRCTGTIAAIGAQDVAIRRNSDHGICRVTVQQLKQGRYVLWPVKSS